MYVRPEEKHDCDLTKHANYFSHTNSHQANITSPST